MKKILLFISIATISCLAFSQPFLRAYGWQDINYKQYFIDSTAFEKGILLKNPNSSGYKLIDSSAISGSITYGTAGQTPYVNGTADGFSYGAIDQSASDITINVPTINTTESTTTINISDKTLTISGVANSIFKATATDGTRTSYIQNSNGGGQSTVRLYSTDGTSVTDLNVAKSNFSLTQTASGGDNFKFWTTEDGATKPVYTFDYVSIPKFSLYRDSLVSNTLHVFKDSIVLGGDTLGLSDVTGGGSDNQQISFTTSIPFNYTNTGVTLHTLTQNETFTINTTGAFTGAETYYEIQSNDTYTIDTDVCTDIGTKSFSTDADTVNVLKFEYVNSRCLLTILDKYYTAPLVAGYYVDSEAGDDNNDGTSEFEAVQTLAKITELVTLDETPTIYLKRGSTFREQFEIPDSSYVTVYGTGDKPIISGADTVDESVFTLTSGQTYTYEQTIIIDTTINPYMISADSVMNEVLMVWVDDTLRMGLGKALTIITAIDSVEKYSGTWWYDKSISKLYIHPTNDDNPTTNGKNYEISVRSLALYGGDAFYAEHLQAEKCYAKNTSGQQGYQILGYKSGHYYKCIGRNAWNHAMGVANEEDADTLLFENCLAEDCEVYTGFPAATIFVAYKQDLTTTAVVEFKNCVSRQYEAYGAVQVTGFFCHGNSIKGIVNGCGAENLFWGYQDQTTDGDTTHFIGTNKAVACSYGVYGVITGNSLSNFEFKDCATAVRTDRTNYTLDSLKIIDCPIGVSGFGRSSTITNSVFAKEGAYANLGGLNYGSGIFQVSGCSFYNVKTILEGTMQNCDYNNYFGSQYIMKDLVYGTYLQANLTDWQTDSGQDLNSTTDDPGYPSDFFDVIITDPTE